MGLQTCKPDVPTAKEVREKLEIKIEKLERALVSIADDAHTERGDVVWLKGCETIHDRVCHLLGTDLDGLDRYREALAGKGEEN